MHKSESFTITGETLYVTTKASVHDAVSDLFMMLYVEMLLLPINADVVQWTSYGSDSGQ